MRVLGLSCDYHDAAAALVVDGEVAAAAEEERFTRRKHDESLPVRAIASCLAVAGIGPDDLDAVIFHEKPVLTVTRALAVRQHRGPLGIPAFVRDMPVLLKRNLMIADRVDRALRDLGATRPPRLRYSEHHLSHAAAAFLPSPFESAAIVTLDGLGEWVTGTIGRGEGHRVDLVAEQRFPDSLGLLYSLVTQWCGFAPNDGEYKVMGLAPYGSPRFLEALERLAGPTDDGSLRVDLRAVRTWSVAPRRLRRVAALLGGPPREPDGPLTDRELDLAASIQHLVERSLLATARRAHELTGSRNVCLAGGVALNCVANSRLLADGPFDDVWVQPAAGDAGSALGAALWWTHHEQGRPRPHLARGAAVATGGHGAPASDGMAGAALGPAFEADEVTAFLADEGVEHEVVDSDEALVDQVAEALAGGAIVGWFSGRMEFGPRALGHRSILADPRSPAVHRDLNARVKGRELFRPFAPAVPWERAADWFVIDRPSPYMLFTHQVHPDRRVEVGPEPATLEERANLRRSEIPAATHVDGSARVQTVHRETNPRFHALLEAFGQRTGCPVLLNTSFNVAGEPVVCTPAHALATALAAGLDLLVLDRCLVPLSTDRVPLAAEAGAS